MQNITLIRDPGAAAADDSARDKQITELFNGPFRRILEVHLRNGAVLSRHNAAEPITVYCISGNGVFAAGDELEDRQPLSAGTLLTLEAGIYHEVTAEPDLQFILSKFKNS